MLSNEKWFGVTDTGFYPETIEQSLRFDGSTSKLLRTPTASGNQKKWTSSMWVKRCETGILSYLWSGSSYSGNNGIASLYFHSSDKLYVYYDAPTDRIGDVTSDGRLFRDTTGWYHIVWAVDAVNTVHKIWVNGELASTNTGVYPTNFDYGMNRNATSQAIGTQAWGNTQFFDGYIAEFVHLDGQYLDETYFGEFKNGVWIPKNIQEQNFTFGTNGFYLPFSDINNIGYDYQTSDRSGTTNDYTATGLASTDVVLDSPTNNFCTYNNLYSWALTNTTLSEGNLKSTETGTTFGVKGIGTIAVNSGKWYFETHPHLMGNANYANIGVIDVSEMTTTDGTGSDTGKFKAICYASYQGRKSAYGTGVDSSITLDGLGQSSYGDSWGATDIIGVALDIDNDAIYFSKNGTWQNSATSAEISAGTTTNSAYTGKLSGLTWTVAQGNGLNANNFGFTLNAGQDPSFAGYLTGSDIGTETPSEGAGVFKYAPPTGFLALCSSNLPDTTLSPNQDEQATDYFNTRPYNGDGQTSQAITGVGFQPDWLWIKERSSTSDHVLVDSNRGASKFLVTSDTNGAQAESTATTVHQSFDPDGFTVGVSGATNQNGQTYASWNWRAGGTAVSNTVGSIPTSVSVSTDAGFSIITYTGNGTAGATIGHGLGVKPAMIIIKRRTGTAQDWMVYHHKNTSEPATDYLSINRNLATQDTNVIWNDTEPDTSVITLGGHDSINQNTQSHVAYVFAEIEGYSKFGSYTGNGSSSGDGTYVYLGFRPSYIMTKRTDSTGNWLIIDNKRDVDNVAHHRIIPNKVNVESTSVVATLDILSNGFKRKDNNTDVNANGGTYIYMAFGDGNTAKFGNSR